MRCTLSYLFSFSSLNSCFRNQLLAGWNIFNFYLILLYFIPILCRHFTLRSFWRRGPSLFCLVFLSKEGVRGGNCEAGRTDCWNADKGGGAFSFPVPVKFCMTTWSLKSSYCLNRDACWEACRELLYCTSVHVALPSVMLLFRLAGCMCRLYASGCCFIRHFMKIPGLMLANLLRRNTCCILKHVLQIIIQTFKLYNVNGSNRGQSVMFCDSFQSLSKVKFDLGWVI